MKTECYTFGLKCKKIWKMNYKSGKDLPFQNWRIIRRLSGLFYTLKTRSLPYFLHVFNSAGTVMIMPFRKNQRGVCIIGSDALLDFVDIIWGEQCSFEEKQEAWKQALDYLKKRESKK